MSALDELFTPGAIVHDPGRELRGRAAIRQGLSSLLAAFPDVVYAVEDQFGEGDRVASRLTQSSGDGSVMEASPGTNGAVWGSVDGVASATRFVLLSSLRPFERYPLDHVVTEYWAPRPTTDPEDLVPFTAEGVVRDQDGIYMGGGDQLLLNPAASADGFAAVLPIGLNLSDTSVGAPDGGASGPVGPGGPGGPGPIGAPPPSVPVQLPGP